MLIPESDAALFFKLHPALLTYANQKLKVAEAVSTAEEFMKLPLKKKTKVWEAFWNHAALIDPFIAENPYGFSTEELETVRNWKHHVRGRFFIVKYLKNYAVFLDEKGERVYGVLGITSRICEIMGEVLPLMVEAVLIPLGGRIIYDGFLGPYNVAFGRGSTRDIQGSYEMAKARYGIITSLPFWGGQEENRPGLLKFYLRSEENREIYADRVEEMLHRDPALLKVYHHEMGKVHARHFGKKLRQMGLKDAFFAILEGVIVAGAPSRGELEKIIAEIVPPERRNHIYIFKPK